VLKDKQPGLSVGERTRGLTVTARKQPSQFGPSNRGQAKGVREVGDTGTACTLFKGGTALPWHKYTFKTWLYSLRPRMHTAEKDEVIVCYWVFLLNEKEGIMGARKGFKCQQFPTGN